MRIHQKNTRQFQWILWIVLAGWFLVNMLAAPLGWAEKTHINSDVYSTTSAASSRETPINFEGLGPSEESFRVFRSLTGDYLFEAPEDWERAVEPSDSARDVIFVGPINRAEGTVVFFTISRYPYEGTVGVFEQTIDQLQQDRSVRVMSDTLIHLKQHLGHSVTVEEQAFVPLRTLEIAEFQLIKSMVQIQKGHVQYLLEYVASPELYVIYRPIFEHVLATFRLVPHERTVCDLYPGSSSVAC